MYILIIPAFGIISHIISTYSGRPVFGQRWPILIKSKATNYMRESEELVEYCSISQEAAGVKNLTKDNYDLQITKARILGYKLRTERNQLGMQVGISEAICLLTKGNNSSGGRGERRENRENITEGKNEKGWNEWLAGLIDGDGCFLLSKKGYASLEIVMEERDKHCLYQVKQRYGGSVKLRSGVKWLRYRLHHRRGLLELIEGVNGEIRNPTRLIQLSKICERYSVELKQPKRIEFRNGWLSGLIDSEGSVIMNEKSSQLKITVGQKNKLILDLLKKVYGGEVYVERGTESFKWVVYRKEEIKNLVSYLEKYPLRSEKKNRILMIKRYEELREMKAHLGKEGSIEEKAWREFKRKWKSYES